MNRTGSWLAIAAALTVVVSGCASGGSSGPITPSATASAFPMFTDGLLTYQPVEQPADETWAQLPKSPLSARRGSAGAWVDDRFVIVGGWTDSPCPSAADCNVGEPAERNGATFNPHSGVWERIEPAPVPVSAYSTAVVDGDLYILTVDASTGSELPSFLRYDVDADAWATLPAPPTAGILVAAGDKVLAIPGSDETGVGIDAVFDPASQAWTPLPDDPLGPSFDREAVWLGDELLLAAKDLVGNSGSDGPSLVQLARLDGTFAAWSLLPSTDIIGIGVTSVAGRVVFPFYGAEDGGSVNRWERPLANGGIFNPVDETWTGLPELPAGTILNEYSDGRAPQAVGDTVLLGGRLLLDPVTGALTTLPEPPWRQRTLATVITGPDSILVWGGATYDDAVGANHADGYMLSL